MESNARAEIRRLKQDRFPRWVIIDDADKPSADRRFWSGQDWVSELRAAMLFADKDAVVNELIAIHRNPS